MQNTEGSRLDAEPAPGPGRRRFIVWLPVMGAGLLAACSERPVAPADAPAGGTPPSGTSPSGTSPSTGTGATGATGATGTTGTGADTGTGTAGNAGTGSGTTSGSSPSMDPSATPPNATAGTGQGSVPGSTGSTLPRVSPSEPQAQALGYVETAAQADKARFPKYETGQLCSNCALYTGGPSEGPCSIFGGRNVAAGGWCSAWVRKG